MDRYTKIAAAEKIDGYYSPPMACLSSSETITQAFESAKLECARHLRDALANVENMTLDQFLSGRCGK